jgi:hypothetical protein
MLEDSKRKLRRLNMEEEIETGGDQDLDCYG